MKFKIGERSLMGGLICIDSKSYHNELTNNELPAN